MNNSAKDRNANKQKGHLMNLKKLILCAATLLISLLIGNCQNYAVSWFTIAGGGGASQGGAYTLRGTIGQWDAGRSSGGAFTLLGGFWAGSDVSPTPALRIFLTGPITAVVAWPAPST